MNAVVGVVIGLGLLVWFRSRTRRRAEAAHRDRLTASLVFTVDLMAVVVGSGGTVRQAVAAVACDGPEVVRPAFAGVLRRSLAGELLPDALAAASSALGPAYHPLIGALVATERDGAPLSVLLQRLADDAQQTRQWQTDALARRLPVALLMPLVCCLLPAVVIGAIVPLAIVAVRHLNIA